MRFVGRVLLHTDLRQSKITFTDPESGQQQKVVPYKVQSGHTSCQVKFGVPVRPSLMPRKKKQKVGDLIEVFRPGYQHWAIYVGDGYVIHLAPPSETAGAGSSSLMSVLYDSALVKKERLSDVVGNDVYRVNNLLDDEYEPRDTNLLLKKAHSLVGQTLPFSVFSRNCEHFVTDLRYGKSTSSQVKTAVIGGLAVLGVGLLALTTGLFSKSEKRSKTNSVHFFD